MRGDVIVQLGEPPAGAREGSLVFLACFLFFLQFLQPFLLEYSGKTSLNAEGAGVCSNDPKKSSYLGQVNRWLFGSRESRCYPPPNPDPVFLKKTVRRCIRCCCGSFLYISQHYLYSCRGKEKEARSVRFPFRGGGSIYAFWLYALCFSTSTKKLLQEAEVELVNKPTSILGNIILLDQVEKWPSPGLILSEQLKSIKKKWLPDS